MLKLCWSTLEPTLDSIRSSIVWTHWRAHQRRSIDYENGVSPPLILKCSQKAGRPKWDWRHHVEDSLDCVVTSHNANFARKYKLVVKVENSGFSCWLCRVRVSRVRGGVAWTLRLRKHSANKTSNRFLGFGVRNATVPRGATYTIDKNLPGLSLIDSG